MSNPFFDSPPQPPTPPRQEPGVPLQPYGQTAGQPYGQQYGYPAYGQGVPQGNMSQGLSITSLVLGLANLFGFGFLLIPPIAGVILGHIGLKKEPTGRGMAIAGLVLNYLMLLVLLGTVLFFVWVAMTVGDAGDPAPTLSPEPSLNPEPSLGPDPSLSPEPSSSPMPTGRVV